MLEGGMGGILAVILAGFSNGSFPAPSKGISAWKWEHIWFVYSFWAMALLPVGLALAFSHGTILQQLFKYPGLAEKVAIFGVLFGIGSLLFGVSLVRLGMAITNALVNGIVAFCGSLGPILIGSAQVGGASLLWLIGGLSLLALSLVLCAAASISRDQAQTVAASNQMPGSHSVVAVFIAVVAGVMSAMINIGFAYGVPLSSAARAAGCPLFLASITIWVPVLLGGLVCNMGYPAYLIQKNGSWSTFLSGKGIATLWVRSSSMGVLWFGAILLYGFGAALMGSDGPVYGWAIIITVSILTSNTWGAVTGEWKNSGARPKVLMWFSTALLIGSLILLTGQQLSK